MEDDSKEKNEATNMLHTSFELITIIQFLFQFSNFKQLLKF